MQFFKVSRHVCGFAVPWPACCFFRALMCESGSCGRTGRCCFCHCRRRERHALETCMHGLVSVQGVLSLTVIWCNACGCVYEMIFARSLTAMGKKFWTLSCVRIFSGRCCFGCMIFAYCRVAATVNNCCLPESFQDVWSVDH